MTYDTALQRFILLYGNVDNHYPKHISNVLAIGRTTQSTLYQVQRYSHS